MLINKNVKYSNEDQQLDEIFSALADPTRRSIIMRLATKDATVNELASAYEITLPAVSRHLKVLEQAGLISRSRNAQERPARLEPASLKQATDWLEEYRKFWEVQLDGLDEYLQQLKVTKEK